jgi:transcriptional regulator with XRE-family HTH domain
MIERQEHQRLSKFVGARLREFREKKAITVKQLAATLGLTEAAIRKSESGENLNTYIKLVETARILGVTPNDILGFSEPAPRGRDPSHHEALRGLVEGGLMSRGMELEEAEALAHIVLEVSESPEVHSEGHDRIRHNARLLCRSIIRRFFEK